MATAIQQTTQSGARELTIFGEYPSGEFYSDTVQAGSPFEAMIKVLSDRRYSDDGGDLEVSCVIDAQTGKVVDSVLLSAELDLLSDVEAIEQVIEKVTDMLSSHPLDGQLDASSMTSFDCLRAYVEYFGLVLSEAPDALEGLTQGIGSAEDEDMALEFEDIRGIVHEFEPADALLALADAAICGGLSAAAFQVKTLATVARNSLNLAALDALGTY